MIHFFLIVNRQGKTRLSKFYTPVTQKERQNNIREITQSVINRPRNLCSVIEWRDKKIVYRRYASLFFIICIDKADNELVAIEGCQLFVELLDNYFRNVCEVDLIFNFHRANFLLDEIIVGGEFVESSKKATLRSIAEQDKIVEALKAKKSIKSQITKIFQ